MSVEANRGGHSVVPYATDPAWGRGRLVPEPDCPTRSGFQRDRDRIIHSSAFRRLTYKTQVFVYHEGDHYRTRLTHSIEVAQMARAMARTLRANEDLAEAISLAHDLGHSPFGHAGERALDEALSDIGGFDHNAQSLRVVTSLERKYAAFNGLNLTWDTLEGLVKHNGPLEREATAQPILDYDAIHDLRLDSHAGLEAQIAAIADDIAYNNHDIDDGLRAGLIQIDDLRGLSLPGRFIAEVEAAYPQLGAEQTFYEVNRRMITGMINDVTAETARRISEIAPSSGDDLRRAGQPVVRFSAGMAAEIEELRTFLMAAVYRHARVYRVMQAAELIVKDLTVHYRHRPHDMPDGWRERAEGRRGGDELAKVVRDFVAGMTDRYAVQAHRALFDHTPDLS